MAVRNVLGFRRLTWWYEEMMIAGLLAVKRECRLRLICINCDAELGGAAMKSQEAITEKG